MFKGEMMKARCLFISLLVLTLPMFADTIYVEKPVIYPDTGEYRRYITSVLQDAAFYIETVYKGDVILTGSVFNPVSDTTTGSGRGRANEQTAANADFIMTVNAVNQPQSTVVSLNLVRKSDGKSAEPFTFLGEWVEGQGDYYGRSIYYMWASIFDFALGLETEPPDYVDEFPMDMIPKTAMPVANAQLYPYSLAIGNNGNVVVAGNSLAIEFDRYFRILGFPGKRLVEEGNYTYAYGTGVTPGGTLYFRPSTGSDVYIFYPGTDRPRRLRTGFSGAGAFTVLPDGSAVLVDGVGRRAMRFAGRERIELDIFPQEYSYVTAVCAGPEGNIWVKDSMDKHIRIYSPEGKLLNGILPMTANQDLSGVRAMTVYKNGDFILLSPTSLMKFTKTGLPLWKIQEIPSPDRINFMQVMDVEVDSLRGLIYLTDLSGRRIFKLLDRNYTRSDRIAAPEESRTIDIDFEKKLIAVNQELLVDPYSIDAYSKKARLYEDAGAVEVAMMQWERVLDSDPFATEAETRLAELEMQLLTEKAGNLRTKTLELLDTLGPESARASYSETVQVYEQILYRNPGDTDASRELAHLREAFQRAEGGSSVRRQPIQIVGVTIDRLFPSLLQYYRHHPPGAVTVRNPLEEPITEVTASVYIKNLMDFPSEAQPVSELDPGESIEIILPVQLNRSVFDLEEDLPTQVHITVRYYVDGEAQQVETFKTATVYRRTALSWDDSRKLAAFIMPNEEIVSRFSHRTVSSAGDKPNFRLSSALLRSATICDALGNYGIEYIEDPSSPISAVLENEQAVDTVRFPRTTLYYQSGDCDDSTALTCSLLESVGIPTAIVTTPGHVFCAFDTGEPAGNGWQYTSGECDIIVHDGSVWIPVETTIVEQGFFTAWKEASKEIRRYKDSGDFEFLPVRESWQTYPSLPLPQSGITIVEPAPQRVIAARDASLEDVTSSLYTAAIAALQPKLSTASGRRKAMALNQLGILQARFGEDREAEAAFSQAIQLEERFLSSYINMSNLKLLQDKPREALDYLERAKEIRDTSVVVNALLAKTHYHIGEQKKAEDYYQKVVERSPDVAKDIAYIQSSSGTARAAEAGNRESFFWNIEEE